MQDQSQYRRNQTVAEAAADIRVSDETIRRGIRRGAPHDRIGRAIRVSADELRAWFSAHSAYRENRA